MLATDFIIFASTLLVVTVIVIWWAVRRRLLRSGAFIAVALVMGVLVAAWAGADSAAKSEKDRLRETLRGLAPTYAVEIDRMGHAELTFDTPGDHPKYLDIIEAEKRWLKVNPRLASMYTFRVEADNKIRFVAACETDYDRNGKYEGEVEARVPNGEVYEVNEGQRASMLAAFGGHAHVSEEPQTDRWGTWVTAYHPLRNAEGKIEGVVALDLDASAWIDQIQRARTGVFVAYGLGTLVGLSMLAAFCGRMLAQRHDAQVREAVVLRSERENFETLVNSIEGVVFESGPENSGFTFMSPQASRILGAPPEYWLESGRWDSHFHPDDRIPAQMARLAAAQNKGSYSLEYRMVLPDGDTVWLRETGNSIEESDCCTTAVRGILTDITSQKKAAEELEMTHRRLVDTSRRAGMAEVATGVLHNVGNVLNSVNVASTLIHQKIHESKVSGISQLAGLLKAQNGSLGRFFDTDPRAHIIPDYLNDIAAHLQEEQDAVVTEVDNLVKNVEHIKHIVDIQQSYARCGGIMESLNIAELVEDAIGINAASLTRHRIRLERQFESGVTLVHGDKSKILQILVNLIRNAKHAVDEFDGAERVIRILVQRSGRDSARVTVQDTGMGISAENMPKLFGHGFTTRRQGHGFGLHSSEAAAREMGGALTAHSDGPGLGASFVFEMKLAQPVDTAPDDAAFPVSFIRRGTAPSSPSLTNATAHVL